MASKTFKALLPLLLMAASVVIALILIASRPDNVVAPPVERSALVDVAVVALQNLRIPVQAQGTVNPHRETGIVSEVAGRIISVSPSFNSGGYLAEGEVLLKIDDRDYQANLLRTRAAVESAKSALAQEKGRAEVALNEWKTLPKNSQRSQDATNLYLRKPQLATAEAQLLSAQADMKKAEDDLDRTIIRAPYNAIIRSKRSDLGRYITPETPVADIFAVDFAEVRLAISQNKLAYLDLPRPGQTIVHSNAPRVNLYTDVGGEVNQWLAKLTRTEAVFDERSRVLFAVAQVDDPYALQLSEKLPLRMGTFVKANILGREMNDMVVLPRYVLRAGGYVWVVDEQLSLRNRKVQTLRTEGQHIYVSSGLQEGDLVCLTNLSGAMPGLRVRINNQASTLQPPATALEAAETKTGNEVAEPVNAPDQTLNENDTASTASV